MSRASRIIVADADSKNAGLLAFGFEREGIEPVVAYAAADVPRMAIAGDVDGVVLSLASGSPAGEAMKALRAAGPMVARLPVVALGDPAARAEVMGAGATDFLPRPHFVRDVVSLARFHTLRKASTPTVWAGELGDFAGIFYLIRGLSSVGRTGVLTIVRSLRRAELRFYEGEVTSAQVGTLHGMAALHQVLLWTEGKLDFRAEAVVRRQQIPLAPQELIDDLGRFLRDFHELAPDLSPGVVLDQDLRRVAECVDKIPKEVNPVLRLFDGARLLSDIVEDSPFRVFETVKIAARLVKLGALKPVAQTRPRGENSALKVDDWMVGTTPPQGVPVGVGSTGSEPVGPKPGVPASPPPASDNGGSVASARQKKKAKKERERESAKASSPPPVSSGAVVAAAPASGSEPVDWGKLPGAAGSVWDLPGYAPVVPSQVATGEISSVGRPEPDANLAVAGKVVAQDLASAVQQASRETGPKVLVDAPPEPPVAIKGTARERVDEISAPVPQEIAATPAQTTRPGPVPVPVPAAVAAPVAAPIAAPVAPAAPAQPVRPPSVVVESAAAGQPIDDGPIVTPTIPTIYPRARLSALHAVAGEVTTPNAEPRSHGGSGQTDSNGVVSGAVSSRSPAAFPEEPERGEKIVVLDSEFDPPRPPSVEIEIVRPPPEFDDSEVDATEMDLSAHPGLPELPALRSIADEEPSQPSARMPNILPAPAGIAPAVPVAEAPEAVVVSTPSAPTVQVIAAPEPVPVPPPVVAPPPGLVALEPPVVHVPPSLLAVPPPAVPAPSLVPVPPPVVDPPAAVAAMADDAARSAADAAHAAARAVAFDAIDEEFFNQEHQFANAKAPPSESFDDLDGHAPAPAAKGSFWRRLIGGAPPPQPQRRRRPTTVPPPSSSTSKPTGGQKTQPVNSGKRPGSGGKKR